MKDALRVQQLVWKHKENRFHSENLKMTQYGCQVRQPRLTNCNPCKRLCQGSQARLAASAGVIHRAEVKRGPGE